MSARAHVHGHGRGRPIAGRIAQRSERSDERIVGGNVLCCSTRVRICASCGPRYTTPFDGPVAPDVNTTAASAWDRPPARSRSARPAATAGHTPRRASGGPDWSARRRCGARQRSVLAAASARRVPIRWSGSATFIAALIWAGPVPPSISTGTAPSANSHTGRWRDRRPVGSSGPPGRRPAHHPCAEGPRRCAAPHVDLAERTVRPSAPSRTATRSAIAGSCNAALRSTGAEGGGISPSAPSVSSQSTTIEATSVSSETMPCLRVAVHRRGGAGPRDRADRCRRTPDHRHPRPAGSAHHRGRRVHPSASSTAADGWSASSGMSATNSPMAFDDSACRTAPDSRDGPRRGSGFDSSNMPCKNAEVSTVTCPNHNGRRAFRIRVGADDSAGGAPPCS